MLKHDYNGYTKQKEEHAGSREGFGRSLKRSGFPPDLESFWPVGRKMLERRNFWPLWMALPAKTRRPVGNNGGFGKRRVVAPS